VEVPKDFIREHERLELEKEYLELEVDHLRERLAEHKEYIEALQERIESDDDVIYLEDLDDELSGEETFRIG
jgi:regulator of replication initiation timing